MRPSFSPKLAVKTVKVLKNLGILNVLSGVPLASGIRIGYSIAHSRIVHGLYQDLAHSYGSLGNSAEKHAVLYCLNLSCAGVETSSNDLAFAGTALAQVLVCSDDCVCRVLVGTIDSNGVSLV